MSQGASGADEEPVAGGGEAACLAARVCPECGAVLSEDPHRGGCPASADGTAS